MGRYRLQDRSCLVFLYDAAFIMILLAVAMSRVPSREWLSSSVVVFFLGLLALACQPATEELLRGQDVGKTTTAALGCAALWCCFAVRQTWLDLRKSPNPRRRRRQQ
jgi:hypothetical protein